MINTVYGTFKDAQDLREYAKQAKISEYRNMAKVFAEHPSMELSSQMSDVALVLHDSYNLNWEDIEALEY